MVTLMDMAMVMDTMVMERGKPRPLLLLKLMLSQVIIIMATLTDMVTDMAIMDMERGKLMLHPATIIMVMDTDMVDMVMDMDMERGRLMLPLDIIMVMDTPMEDMVDMVMDMDMERGKLMLKLDILIMDMAMVDTVTDMATMDMERGRPPPDILIMVMVDMVMDMAMVVMDTMVKQYLFISFSKISCIHWNLLESSQQKHRPLFKKNKNSFFEIKSTKLTE